jgi:hypothetical protein
MTAISDCYELPFVFCPADPDNPNVPLTIMPSLTASLWACAPDFHSCEVSRRHNAREPPIVEGDKDQIEFKRRLGRASCAPFSR